MYETTACLAQQFRLHLHDTFILTNHIPNFTSRERLYFQTYALKHQESHCVDYHVLINSFNELLFSVVFISFIRLPAVW